MLTPCRAKQLMDERNQELEEALTQMNCRTENLDKVAQDLAKVQANKDKCTASLQQVDQEMAALRTKLEQLTQHLEEVRKSALEVTIPPLYMVACIHAISCAIDLTQFGLCVCVSACSKLLSNQGLLMHC